MSSSFFLILSLCFSVCLFSKTIFVDLYGQKSQSNGSVLTLSPKFDVLIHSSLSKWIFRVSELSNSPLQTSQYFFLTSTNSRSPWLWLSWLSNAAFIFLLSSTILFRKWSFLWRFIAEFVSKLSAQLSHSNICFVSVWFFLWWQRALVLLNVLLQKSQE